MPKLLSVLTLLLLIFFSACSDPVAEDKPPESTTDRPNVIVIFADDQGYGDLGCYGSPSIRTPRLDRMAAEGLKLTNFYAFPSCSPSRAALLTGCYPPRVGIPNVIGPPGPQWTANQQHGLHPNEVTIADMLRPAGYATACVGKWHLGHEVSTMPLIQGFDEFFGLPYSNDMRPENERAEWPDLPLYQNTEVVELNPDQTYLTDRYLTYALDFIERKADSSFFLYLAHSMPHVPLYNHPDFADRSGQGVYPDVIEEIDAGVGRILDKLDELGIGDNTLVVYTSDNGPWLAYGNHGGSAGPFREGKGTTFEGGMRVPFIARWPAAIEARTVDHTPAALIDLLPTIAAATGTALPSATIDGENLLPVFRQDDRLEQRPIFYCRNGKAEGVRLGEWKLHATHFHRHVLLPASDGVHGEQDHPEHQESLVNLLHDPGELFDRMEEEPEKAAELRQLMDAFNEELAQNKREPLRYEMVAKVADDE